MLHAVLVDQRAEVGRYVVLGVVEPALQLGGGALQTAGVAGPAGGAQQLHAVPSGTGAVAVSGRTWSVSGASGVAEGGDGS